MYSTCISHAIYMCYTHMQYTYAIYMCYTVLLIAMQKFKRTCRFCPKINEPNPGLGGLQHSQCSTFHLTVQLSISMMQQFLFKPEALATCRVSNPSIVTLRSFCKYKFALMPFNFKLLWIGILPFASFFIHVFLQ